jgi:hypothetical protein
MARALAPAAGSPTPDPGVWPRGFFLDKAGSFADSVWARIGGGGKSCGGSLSKGVDGSGGQR